VELLEQLRNTIADLSTRASKLNDDYRSRMARERLRTRAQVQEHEQTIATRLAEVATRFDELETGLEARYEARKTRIGKAFHSSKEQRLREIEDEVGARRYESQKRMLQAEKDRENGLSAAAKLRQERQTKLADENQRLGKLEHEAQVAFAGYGALKKGFFDAYHSSGGAAEGSPEALLEKVKDLQGKAEAASSRLRRNLLLLLFRPIWVWLVLAAISVGAVPVLTQLGRPAPTYPVAAAAAVGVAILFVALRQLGVIQARGLAKTISEALAGARVNHDAATQKTETDYATETKRLQDDYTQTLQSVEQNLKRAQAQAGEKRVSLRMRIDEKTVRAQQTHERLHKLRQTRLQQAREQALTEAKADTERTGQSIQAAGDAKERSLEQEQQKAWADLEAAWNSALKPIYAALDLHNKELKRLFPPWADMPLATCTPPATLTDAATFGALQISAEELGGVPLNQRLAFPQPDPLKLRLALTYPQQGSLLIETSDTGHDEAISTLNDVILRLLSTSPPGRLNFTILDPVGLGQNFAGVMHMADYEEQIINNRIWTQPGQIEQRLADLNEHMEKVIQMYLRNEYATIAEYNQQAGVIAEKYHFLVVADFPAQFSDVAAKRLASIAASGARCGVFMLIHWDRRLPVPQDFLPDELRKNNFVLVSKGGKFEILGKPLAGTSLQLEAPPAPENAIELVHRLGRLSRDSSRVEVPFEHVAPADDEMWSEDTTSELRVPIGRTGATKLQYLAVGKGTCQHGLIAGKTGSGKSTLFHVIVTNLALWCSPEQVEFYLVDFKKGVEFKAYATHRLPHARVIAIESDREFGLSVLERVDAELKRRGEMFRRLGVQDIAGYKRAGGKESIPRTLLLIDEFQEFFVEDDRVSQSSALLLDRIVRQGRAFGIHVLLGSQTLGGAYTIARTTLGQMVIRIALQCNEADAYLIMDESNPAPRLLSRPGEGIYNDTAGSIEGNSPFQVVWLPEEVRDRFLAKVSARATAQDKPPAVPIVFEGNAPAEVRENALLRNALEHPAAARTSAPRMWLGAPNSIKGPTEVVFDRQSGNNLLIVGQNDESILAMLGIGMVSLAAQLTTMSPRFIFCDSSAPGTPTREFLDHVFQALPSKVEIVRGPELPDTMQQLDEEMRRRLEATDPGAAPPVFLFIHGLQRFSRLKYEEDFSMSAGDTPTTPGAVLNALLTEGTRLGIHVIATADSYSSLTRFMTRKAISEFELRVLFQMSANDSASLIDNPKAGLLGLHRAILQNAKQGWLETFRPYALPDLGWIEQAGAALGRANA
jgi:hypothetical protein